MIQWKSVTDFDRNLELSITESTQYRDVTCTYTGFVSLEQATVFKDWWVNRIGNAYFPSARAYTDTDGVVTVKTTRADSCD